MPGVAFKCGTPKEFCVGGTKVANNGLDKSTLCHGTRESAMKCYIRYLRLTGYTQISAHEFRPPNGGPILVINRVSRFGGMLRRGKAGEGNAKQSKKRIRPNKGSGVIV